jgi:hypothetical protein
MRHSATDSNEFGVSEVKSSGIGAFSKADSATARVESTAEMAHLIADFGSRIAD